MAQSPRFGPFTLRLRVWGWFARIYVGLTTRPSKCLHNGTKSCWLCSSSNESFYF